MRVEQKGFPAPPPLRLLLPSSPSPHPLVHFVKGIIKDTVLTAPTSAPPPPPPPPVAPAPAASPRAPPPPAPTHPEFQGKRVDVDGHAYSFEDFLNYHGDEEVAVEHWQASRAHSTIPMLQKSVRSVIAVNRFKHFPPRAAEVTERKAAAAAAVEAQVTTRDYSPRSRPLTPPLTPCPARQA